MRYAENIVMKQLLYDIKTNPNSIAEIKAIQWQIIQFIYSFFLKLFPFTQLNHSAHIGWQGITEMLFNVHFSYWIFTEHECRQTVSRVSRTLQLTYNLVTSFRQSVYKNVVVNCSSMCDATNYLEINMRGATIQNLTEGSISSIKSTNIEK